MKKKNLEVYELGDLPVAVIEQVAEQVLAVLLVCIEAANTESYAVMPIGMPVELQATRLVLFHSRPGASSTSEQLWNRHAISLAPR